MKGFCKHQFPQIKLDKEAGHYFCDRCDLPTECQHPNQKFSTDDSCGGWFQTCKDCHEIVDAGMMGHN